MKKIVEVLAAVGLADDVDVLGDVADDLLVLALLLRRHLRPVAQRVERFLFVAVIAHADGLEHGAVFFARFVRPHDGERLAVRAGAELGFGVPVTEYGIEQLRHGVIPFSTLIY